MCSSTAADFFLLYVKAIYWKEKQYHPCKGFSIESTIIQNEFIYYHKVKSFSNKNNLNAKYFDKKKKAKANLKTSPPILSSKHQSRNVTSICFTNWYMY